MLRVKLPNGQLTDTQAAVLANISRKFSQGKLQITTRQAVQIHDLTIEHIPAILDSLAAAGLTSIQACGDCVQIITGNPLAGIDPYELFNTAPLVEELTAFFTNNREFSNLPRKYKISVSASPFNTGLAEINDLAFVPATKEVAGQRLCGFHVLVGGGLSAVPQLAQKLNIFVRPTELITVAAAVTALYRDHGYRKDRFKARLKFLVAEWGIQKFEAELLKITGPLMTAGSDAIIGWNAGYFYGVHKQKQAGLNYVGLHVPEGIITADDLDELAAAAKKYGSGSLRTTETQNPIITDIPAANVTALLAEPVLARITPFSKAFVSHIVSCTSKGFCNYALVDTKTHAQTISAYLDQHVTLDTPIRIHLSGCPSACGQQQIADIGLQGTLIKSERGYEEAFEFSLGGQLGPEPMLAQKLKGRIPAHNTAKFLETIINYYKAEHISHESFHDFYKRVGLQYFQAIIDQFLTKAA